MDKEELFDREEKCQKAIRTVRKAVFMRLLVTALLLWIAFGSHMDLWAVGLIVLVLLINLTGMLPLIAEWKKQRRILNELIEMEED